jgi:hypothetical protein
MKRITIADRHSENNPRNKMTLELQGGSPYFAYIWVNDNLHVLTYGNNGGIKIRRERVPRRA